MKYMEYLKSSVNTLNLIFLINQNHPLNGWFALPLEGVNTGLTPQGALKVCHHITITGAVKKQ